MFSKQPNLPSKSKPKPQVSESNSDGEILREGFSARDMGQGGLTREGVISFKRDLHELAWEHGQRSYNQGLYSEPGKRRFSLALRTYTVASDNQESRCLYININ